MKFETKKKHPLTAKSQCILEHIVSRNGVVTSKDVPLISEACNVSKKYVYNIISGNTPTGERINRMVDEILAYQPIGKPRRIAYARAMLEDKMQRRIEQNLPLTDADPLEILNYIRLEEKEAVVHVDNRTQTVNIFDLSNFDDEELATLINNLQGIIDQGEIIDVELVERIAGELGQGAVEAFTGGGGGEGFEAQGEGPGAANE